MIYSILAREMPPDKPKAGGLKQSHKKYDGLNFFVGAVIALAVWSIMAMVGIVFAVLVALTPVGSKVVDIIERWLNG